MQPSHCLRALSRIVQAPRAQTLLLRSSVVPSQRSQFFSPSLKIAACASASRQFLRLFSSHSPQVTPVSGPSVTVSTPSEKPPCDNDSMIPPSIAFENLRASIIARSSRPTLRIFASAVLAGGLLASSCSVVIAVVGGLPVAIGIQKIMAGMLFPAGLSMILFLQADLLTSQMCHFALPRVMAAGDPAAVSRSHQQLPPPLAAKLLSVVFAGNFLGSIAVAAAAAHLLFAALPFSAYAAAAAVAKTSLPFAVAFAKGIGANYLVNVAVYMAACAKTPGGKMVSLWMPIMSFVALGLEHSVANMFIVPVGIFCGADVTIADFILSNLVPVTLGNLLGGLIFASHALLHPLPSAK